MIPASAVERRQRVPPPNTVSGTEQLAEMMPQMYDELRNLAGGYFRGERLEHTLQRTALVHEAYLRLAGEPEIKWHNRSQFLGIFARIMRRTLINYAVARQRMKRGGNNRIELALEFYERRKVNLPMLDEALRELERLDARQAQIVELRFFGGLTVAEISEVIGISPATVKREWATAKIWLRRELSCCE